MKLRKTFKRQGVENSEGKDKKEYKVKYPLEDAEEISCSVVETVAENLRDTGSVRE